MKLNAYAAVMIAIALQASCHAMDGMWGKYDICDKPFASFLPDQHESASEALNSTMPPALGESRHGMDLAPKDPTW